MIKVEVEPHEIRSGSGNLKEVARYLKIVDFAGFCDVLYQVYELGREEADWDQFYPGLPFRKPLTNK